ncbi:MAG: hypothetical protein NVS4B6_24610 [Mycobacterium sp.]
MGYVAVSDLLAANTTTASPIGAPTVDFSLFSMQQLQSLANRASAQIDGFCKQTFVLTNLMERYTGRGTNRLFLRRYPLAQIPDSILGVGSFGQISQSLVADTTFTQAISAAQIAAGINTVVVSDISNLLPGQTFQWGDGTSESGREITSVVPTTAGAVSGPGTLTLLTNLLFPHPLPPAGGFLARVVVNTLDAVTIVMPGLSYFPLPLTQFVVDAQKGEIMNYTPLMFQNLGYATIFPSMLPLLVRYTAGYLLGQYPAVLQEVTIEQARRIALFNMHLGLGGIAGVKSGDVSVNYAAWRPVALGEDLQSYLGPFRRTVGFK